jgi:O-antigen biosynthesis protein
MADDLDHVAGPDDVRMLYQVLLGRQPESDQVTRELAGRPLGDTIEGFFRSDEMADLAARVIGEHQLPHFERLGGGDLADAARWLAAQHMLAASTPATTSWWVLVDAMLTRDGLERRVEASGKAPLARVVRRKAAAEISLAESVRRHLTFDLDWYRQVDQDADLALSTGAYASFEEYFLSRGMEAGRPLLAACTEELGPMYERLRQRDDIGLADVLAETERRLYAGEVGHWLFSPDYYREMALEERLRRRAPASQGPSYVDFLMAGDAREVSPHALFSHYAYRALNPGLSASTALFHDYITRGCFHEARTSAVFDPDYYLAHSPEAQKAVLEGRSVCALQHFLARGIYNNVPFSPDFDVNDYVRRYPEVAKACLEGAIPSASWHFVYKGLRDGLQPNPYFDVDYYRRRYPRARDEMRRLGLGSELEHFLLVGRARGYKANPPLVERKADLTEAKAIFQRRARRSWSNLVEHPLDFQPFRGDTPDLSVIFPVSDGVEFTSRALECAYFACSFALQSQGLRTEVILVDNGSGDGTAGLLATCPGLVLLRYDHAIGYPRAVNAGARAAKGATLIICNNDVEFAPNTFVNVHHRLAQDVSVGVVGGLTILPDETLQEAGSFIESGGGAIGLGRGQDPWDAFFRGIHPADYCTGSLFGVRRADLEALGGLDEGFSPGYYEESDLSFRLRAEKGKRSVIDSSIQLNHFEHASFAKGRPPTAAFTLMQRNRGRFVAKHRQAVARAPSADQLITTAGVQPNAIARTRMLMIEDLVPDARLGSGFPRAAELVKALVRQGVACDILALHANDTVDDFEDPRVRIYRAWMPGQSVAEVFERDIGQYSHVIICRSHNLAALATQLEQARSRHRLKIICDTEALASTRMIERKRLTGSPVVDGELEAAVRLEFSSPVHVAQWIAVTGYEAHLLRSAGFDPVTVIGHSNPAPSREALPNWAGRTRITAVGAIHEPGTPNHDALLWFLDRVYPKCGPAARALQLTAVGFWSDAAQRDLLQRFPQVEYLGAVSASDLARVYRETRVALAPTRFAAGLPLKATEAMMNGVPIVVTDLLERQLVGPDRAGSSGLAVGARTDDGRQYADWVERLASDEASWRSIQRRQFEVAEAHASPAAFDAAAAQLLQAVGAAEDGRS